MSVLLEFSMFPLGKGESLSTEVSGIVDLIRSSGHDYKLTAMGTIVETNDLKDALALVDSAYQLLEQANHQRVYASIKLDIRKGRSHRLSEKVRSIEARIGQVNQ